eukprot:5607292-Amphidinium_carterae.1
MKLVDRRAWRMPYHCHGAVPLDPQALSILPLQHCMHKADKLVIQRWLCPCLDSGHLRIPWPRQGVDMIVDRCIRRLHWASKSKEVQPAAAASMLRVLGNGLTLPARMGTSKHCPLRGYTSAGNIQHVKVLTAIGGTICAHAILGESTATPDASWSESHYQQLLAQRGNWSWHPSCRYFQTDSDSWQADLCSYRFHQCEAALFCAGPHCVCGCVCVCAHHTALGVQNVQGRSGVTR